MTLTVVCIVILTIAVVLGFCAILYSGDRDERGYQLRDETDRCGGQHREIH